MLGLVVVKPSRGSMHVDFLMKISMQKTFNLTTELKKKNKKRSFRNPFPLEKESASTFFESRKTDFLQRNPSSRQNYFLG